MTSAATYKHNDEIEYCPEAGEVPPEAKGKPLEHHLYTEEGTEPQIGPVQNVFEHNILIKVDVFKTEGDTWGKNKDKNEPLKHWRVHYGQNLSANMGPALATGCGHVLVAADTPVNRKQKRIAR